MIWFKGACAPFESIIDGNASCSMNNSGRGKAESNEANGTWIVPESETLSRYPTMDEYAIMQMMDVDSIDLIHKHFFKRYIIAEDKKRIDDWASSNAGIIDGYVMRLASRIYRLNTQMETTSYALYPHMCSAELESILSESLKWRRQNLNKIEVGQESFSTAMDSQIDDIERNFMTGDSIPSLVKSVYLNNFHRVIIDIVNFLNGEAFIDISDGTIDNADFYKLVNWCWANKGIVPKEVCDELYNDIFFEIYLAFEDDPNQFEEYKSKKLGSEMFDKYRNYPVIKM